MVVLNFFAALSALISEPTDIWSKILLNVFFFVENYGWRIVVFTICLKLVLSPLDIYQRVMMRKNQKITDRIKPEVEKLKLQYGSNKQVLQQKQMELNKREGFSYMSACLPVIVTLVIFFWLLSGLQTMSSYMSFKQYISLYDVYESRYTVVMEEGGMPYLPVLDKDGNEQKDSSGNVIYNYQLADDSVIGVAPGDPAYDTAVTAYKNNLYNKAEDAAQTAVFNAYHDTYKVGFLHIKNAWSPDVFWEKPILEEAKFTTNLGKYATDASKSGLDTTTLSVTLGKYDTVMKKLIEDPENKANGLLILPVLCVGFSFLSQFITSRQQKKSGQAAAEGTSMAGTMKMMLIIMPFIMGFFALRYTSIFTLYIITNSAMTLVLNLITTSLLIFIDKKRDKRVSVVVETEPHGEPSNDKSKKSVRKEVVIRYGRPDPNDKKDDK